MSDGRAAMSAYCKAQAQIIKLEKETSEQRKQLSERVRTYRSLLHDELEKQQLTCVEMPVEGKDPLYVRLKTSSAASNIDADVIIAILMDMDSSTLATFADKASHDLPKMVSMLLTQEIRIKHTKKKEKTSLSVSSTKERGFERPLGDSVPDPVRQLARNLISAQEELGTLRKRQSVSKRPIVEEQKALEEEVKKTLKGVDPTSMTTRVHMMQDGDEWVYYLRCKEREVAPSIGVKRIVPMVESAMAKLLEEEGLGREYNATFRLNDAFWAKLESLLKQTIDVARQDTKTTSKISLDRGAPRAGRARRQTDG